MRAVSPTGFSVPTLLRPLPVLALTALLLMGKSLSLNITESVGSNISIPIEYQDIYVNNSKYFCRLNGSDDPDCVSTAVGARISESGRLSLMDDPGSLNLTAQISSLSPADAGLYLCGVDISLRPDNTTEIWVTVHTETQQQTPDRVPAESGGEINPHTNTQRESYSRFMMMVALMCVCALFFVCVFGLFQVLKYKSLRNSGSVLHQASATPNPVPVALQRMSLPDLPKVQNEKEEIHRPTSLDYTNSDSDAYYIDVSSARTPDQVNNTEINNRQSRVYQSLTADSLQESIYHCIDQKMAGL